MTAKFPSFKKFMTPEGAAVYPKLNAPDTKFKAAGEYACKIRLGREDSEALIEAIERQLKDYWPVAKAELEEKLASATSGAAKAKAREALANMTEASKPYRPAYDDEGNETGEYEFNIKMPASYVRKKDQVTVHVKPDVYDAAGKKLKNVPEMWGGSRVIVAGEFRPFNMPIGVGISLRLTGVQIIELQQGGGGERSAASLGFKAREGYSADDESDLPRGREGDDEAEPLPDDDIPF